MIRIEPINYTEWGSRLSEDGHGPFAPRLDSAPRLTTKWNRWSYVAGPAEAVIRCDARTRITKLVTGGGQEQSWDHPLEALSWMEAVAREEPMEGPPFKGGWIGYLSYDLGRLFERIPEIAVDDLDVPLFEFTYHSRVAVHTNEAVEVKTTKAIECDPVFGTRPLDLRTKSQGVIQPLKRSMTRSAYLAAARKAVNYIEAGDVFQVNLAQRFTLGLGWTPPSDVYSRLLKQTPAQFGAYLDFGDLALLSNSPELFLRVLPSQDGARGIVTRPIKGTRPRQPGKLDELEVSEKDRAELNMIVDLERNDLGRICEIGSVKVVEPRTIEAHPTVFHGVATVRGTLRQDVKLVDILRATFPGGSITGAPKIRAMEIIEELEPVRRGPYCGAIGYISCDGHMEFNVAIRTMIVKDGLVHISVGGGIVADSDPDDEYEETLVKAEAMMRAVGISRNDIPQ